jgi:formylglycine-generating enzyme required for sulfatase activity
VRIPLRWSFARAVLTAALVLPALGAGAAGPRPGAEVAPARGPAAPVEMAAIPAGVYRPLYRPLERDNEGRLVEVDPTARPVAAFRLDTTPVTNAAYLAFVRAQPHWQRGRTLRAFVEPGYLAHWAGALELGPTAPERAPVVNVSWFAASAYCEWRGQRLPTTAEWELAAAASETAADGRSDPGFSRRILDWYALPVPAVLPPVGSRFRNLWGVHDLHGLVWEWSEDYAFTLDRGESGGRPQRRELTCGGSAIGALDPTDYAAFMRFAFRSSLRGNYTVGGLGFRCAQSLP